MILRLLALALLLTVAPAEAQLFAQRTISQSITATSADCSTAASCVSISDVFRTLNGTIQVAGTFVGTASFEGTVDGTNWGLLTVTPLAGGAAVTSATGTGIWTYQAALVGVRVRCSAYTSGTITVSIVGR